jgi:hypothetical protein
MANLSHSLVEDISNLYNSIYDEKEDNDTETLTEEQVWEQVEEWVNSLVEEGYDLSECTWEEMYEAYINEAGWAAGALNLLKGLGTAARAAAKSPAAARAASAAGRGVNAAARGAKPVLSGLATKAGKYGTIGALGLAADEVLTGGAGRTLIGKGLEQSRKLGPTLRGEPTSDTAKPTPDSSSSDAKAPSELKGQQVLAKKGGVEGVLDKETGEWKAGKWDETQSKRYGEKKSTTTEAYDIVLDYLFENGHVDTLEEAHYVMLEMDAETIQSIVEADSIAAMRERAAKRRKQRYGASDTSKGGRDDFRPYTEDDYKRGERKNNEEER